ncbi:bifunctional GNAT family N-acetyltransferase/(deoxy)nucleoside triphosphate pyrophosphohydrolase [Paracraurococcus lichenis]|uniref:8-oxo-dGTP diphosphatase n=1 Tax=Paracraurococcus lichenis TaxID=3064888 RepID=A0ABT9DZI1_9PROT|nr:bifunctional GNAT family N-acetyltransferase/(deoxy)nucleoside triphosphate pyrophosphohydrolase [Paracraurococcus sp. LOR1-02]MDO9709155.1 bifunctional GNAT family N-acetyltransferase/(deoxy)nucleoside triphosphate pyrophosphohydrolase [Paracraurococcus sp. LOR1-02]
MTPPDFAPLRTERLVLRPLRAEDAAALHRLVNDWEVAKTLARVPFPYPRDLADTWIASTWAQIAAGEAWHLAIVGEENGEEVLVGCVGLTLSRDRSAAELGYWVGRRFWGHGVAPEAAARLCRWALAHLDIATIRASALKDNPRSQAVLRRIGLRPAGEGRRTFLSRGGPMPVLLFEGGREAITGDPVPAPPPAETAAAPADAKPVLLVAAVALVDADGRVLLARRPEGKPLAGLWEFPGGKVQPGETPEAALIRELKEELDIDVSAACLAPFTFASHGYERFHLLMPLYLCRRWNGAVRAVEGQALAWVRPQKLGAYAMPPADKPLVAMLRDFL